MSEGPLSLPEMAGVPVYIQQLIADLVSIEERLRPENGKLVELLVVVVVVVVVVFVFARLGATIMVIIAFGNYLPE